MRVSTGPSRCATGFQSATIGTIWGPISAVTSLVGQLIVAGSILACLAGSCHNGPLAVAGQSLGALAAVRQAGLNHVQQQQAPPIRPPEDTPPLEDGHSKGTPQHDHQAAPNRSPSPSRNQLDNAGAAGLLLLAKPPETNRLNPAQDIDAELARVLASHGPDMRPTGGFKDPAGITLEMSQRAWRLMHQFALKATRERVEFLWPTVEQLLLDSNVSSGCLVAAHRLASAATRMESWSIQLLNSWGSFPPAGLLEGTFGDIGSYHGCINVPENEQIKHAHYCTIAYKPVLPTRRDYELIIRKEPKGLLELFDVLSSDNKNKANDLLSTTNNQTSTSKRNVFTYLIDNAQYSHYIYYKLGTCFPIDCTPIDVRQIGRLIGSRATLISGPIKCHSKFSEDYNVPMHDTNDPQMATTNHPQLASPGGLKLSSRDLNNGIYIWKPHMTHAQLVSLIIVGSLVCLILAITLVDLVYNYNIEWIFSRNPDLSNGTCSEASKYILANATKSQLASVKTTPTSQAVSSNNNKDSTCCSITSNGTLIQHSNVECLEMLVHSDGKLSQAKPISSNNVERDRQVAIRSPLLQIINECSLITNTREFFCAKKRSKQRGNEIWCINGLRCITMSWIIVAHTMQYNDWSAFARTHEIESQLKSLINQPLFNASYLVDTFFLISGLLTSFSAFRISTKPKQQQPGDPSLGQPTLIGRKKFSSFNYIIGRYLRLTPQIFLVSLLFILLPLLKPNGGPHWYTMTGESSENCSKNWWINLLHIQAFYKTNEMCNYVCWWISIDMFYHLLALFIILFLFEFGSKNSAKFYSIMVLLTTCWQASKHYQMNLPPNILSTIPQTGAMWTQMTLEYFWRPEAHTLPFLFGFYLGHLMAQHGDYLQAWFTTERSLLGWSLAALGLALVSYGTYYWVIGVWLYSRLVATCFQLISQLIWCLSLAWIIVACHYNYGNFIDRFLSNEIFIILGRASYIVYLSHFLILFAFFGSQNLLLEPTQVLMFYVILGNVCLSMLFGSLLCVSFEMPWLKLMQRLMRKLR